MTTNPGDERPGQSPAAPPTVEPSQDDADPATGRISTPAPRVPPHFAPPGGATSTTTPADMTPAPAPLAPSPVVGPDYGPSANQQAQIVDPALPGGSFTPDDWMEPDYRPPLDPVSVVSIPLGAVAGPVGLGLGIAGVARTRRRARRGRVAAWFGTGLGTLSTVALVAAMIMWADGFWDTAPLPADVASAQKANAVQVVKGNCLKELPDDGPVTRVSVVPCSQSHQAQVVETVKLPGDGWFGQEPVQALVASQCRSATGLAGDELAVWSPSKDSWDDGDNTGLCLKVSAK